MDNNQSSFKVLFSNILVYYLKPLSDIFFYTTKMYNIIVCGLFRYLIQHDNILHEIWCNISFAFFVIYLYILLFFFLLYYMIQTNSIAFLKGISIWFSISFFFLLSTFFIFQRTLVNWKPCEPLKNS